MVVDYSQTINRFTLLDAYPLPRITDVVNQIAQYRIFSTIDLRSAYHQLPITCEDRPFTAFEVNGRLYQFLRVPFGVTNGVAVFLREMDRMVDQNGLTTTFPYLDNITICGHDTQGHDANLDKFLQTARRLNLTYNLDNCVFRTTRLAILGCVVENGIVMPDPDRMRPLMDLPSPPYPESAQTLPGPFLVLRPMGSTLRRQGLKDTNEEGEEMENRCVPLHKSQEGFYCTKKLHDATQTSNELTFEEAKDDLNDKKAITETSFEVTFEDYLGCDCCEKKVTYEKLSDEKFRSTSSHTSQDNPFDRSWRFSIASEQSFSRQYSLSRYTSVGTNTSQQFSSDEIWGSSSVSQTAPDEMYFVNNKSLDKNTDSSGRGATQKPTRYVSHNFEKYSVPSSYFKTNESIQLSDSEIAFSTELPPGDIYNLEEECAKAKNTNSSSDPLIQKCALLTQENHKTFDQLQCRKMFQNVIPMAAKKFKTAKKYQGKTDKGVVYQPTPCFPMLHESQMMKLGLNVAKKASIIQRIMSLPLPSEMLERNEVALPINTPLQSKPKSQCIGLPKPEYVGKGDLPAEHQQAEWKDRLEFGLIKQMAYSPNSEISLQKIPFLKPIAPGKGFKRPRSSYIPFIDQEVVANLELNLKHKYITHLC
ncbi:uncharacterized protein [Narcine bancroftii]|uniref:uncharacterized protein n=1 Tax=Narcine bancroftii TaxID=1343680 RepID=UPI0038317F92